MIYGYESTTSRSINRNPVFKVPVPVPPLVLSERRKTPSSPSPPAVKIDYRSHVLKGINLSTQTVLIMADTESIIDLLHSLDRSYAYLRATSPTTNISATTTTNNNNNNNNTTISNNNSGGYTHSSSSLPNSTNLGNSYLDQAMMRIHQHGVTPLSLRGGNSRLFAFIEAANPTRSFLDLSQALDEPVEEVS
jgi:hypothetical protein